MKKTFLTLSLLSLFFFAAPIFAQDNPGDSGPDNVPMQFKIQNPFKVGDNLFELMQGILTNVIMPIGGILCVLAFIFGGFQMVTAQGNEGKITNAKRTLLYAAIGTAILLGATAIELLIRTTFTELLTI